MSNKGNFVRLITLAAMSILGGAGLFFLFQYERDNGRVAAEMPESKARTDGAIAATQRDTANATASRDVAKKNNADATDTDGSALRSTAADVTTYLDNASSELDIDGNGKAEALTDGLLLIRHLFGFSGDALTAGAVASDASRTTAAEIVSFIKERLPST